MPRTEPYTEWHSLSWPINDPGASLFTPLAIGGMSQQERDDVEAVIRAFPPWWSPAQDALLDVNWNVKDFTNQMRSATIAGHTMVFMGPVRPSAATAWHEMWHMQQSDVEDRDGREYARSSQWNRWLFTPKDQRIKLVIRRPEVEWEPTWVGKLLSSDVRRSVLTANAQPIVARAFLAFCDVLGRL